MRALRHLPVLLLLATPVAAQEFRGTISMRMTTPQTAPIDTKVHIANGKQAMVMTSATGPLAGQEMRIVINPAANRMTTLVSTTMMPGAKGFKVVSDMTPAGTSGNNASATAKALGTHQTVAGMRCEDYDVTVNGQVMKMCVTEALGRFSLPEMSGSGGAQRAAWVSAFGNRAVFPLKLSSADSKMTMEVTAVDRGTPAASLFDENPEGYVAPPAMPGARRN